MHERAPAGAISATTIPTCRRCRSSASARCRRSGSRRQLDRVWSTPVPFFKRKLEAAGLRRADLRGSRRPGRHPHDASSRSCGRARTRHPPFGDYRGAPPSAAVRLGASTGTSGRPTLILWTRKDLEVDHAASARGRWRWGLRPGMSLANAHPFGMNAGGWHFSHGVEALGVLNIPSGPPVGEAHIARRRRGVAAPASRTCTGCSATSRRRMPTPRAAWVSTRPPT